MQPSSHRPDHRLSQSITQPMAVPDRRNYPRESQDPSRTSQDPFNPYPADDPRSLSSSYNPRISSISSHLTSQGRREEEGEEESSDDSGSNSGSETEAPNPPMKIRGRGDPKSRSTTVPIPIRQPLNPYREPPDPFGMPMSASMSKSWIPEQFGDSQTRGRREQESSRPSAQQGSYVPSGQGGYRGEGSGGAPSALSKAMSQQPRVPEKMGDSQPRGHREHESRSSLQQGSSRPDQRVGGTNPDYVPSGQGGYRGEGSGAPSALSKAMSQQPKESPRPSGQQGSSGQDPRIRETDAAYVPSGQRGYRGEGSGAPSNLSKVMSQQPSVGGQPAASGERQSRPIYQGMENVRSNREESRVRGMDEDYVGSYRDQGDEPLSRTGGQPISSPRDGQTLWSQRQRESRSSAQQSSSRQDPQSRATVSDYVPSGRGGHRGEGSGGLSVLPQQGRPAASDERQSRPTHQEQGSARSNRQESRVRGMDEDYVGNYSGEGPQSRMGQPISPNDRSNQRAGGSVRSSPEQTISRQVPRTRETDLDSEPSHRAETGGGTSGDPPSRTDNSRRQPEHTPAGANRISYVGDSRSSTILGDTSATPRPSGPPLIPTTSVSQEPSRTTTYDPYLPTDPTQPPRYEPSYPNPSQFQGSLGSQHQGNIGARDPSRPSGQDRSSKQSVDAMRSPPYGGQPTGPLPGWPAHPSHGALFHTSLP